MKYKWELTIGYELEAESEEDAIAVVIDLIKQDWIDFADDGELTTSSQT